MIFSTINLSGNVIFIYYSNAVRVHFNWHQWTYLAVLGDMGMSTFASMLDFITISTSESTHEPVQTHCPVRDFAARTHKAWTQSFDIDIESDQTVRIYFCILKISGEIIKNKKPTDFLPSALSTYDFSSSPYDLFKEKLTELIEQTFNRVGSLYMPLMRYVLSHFEHVKST